MTPDYPTLISELGNATSEIETAFYNLKEAKEWDEAGQPADMATALEDVTTNCEAAIERLQSIVTLLTPP